MGDAASELEYGLSWVCSGASRVLHFGCGDGGVLRMCAEKGTQIHIGVDPSPRLISDARKAAGNAAGARYYFRFGGAAELKTLLESSFDAVIIWGAADGLPRAECELALDEAARLTAKKGRALIKLGGCGGLGEEISLNDMPLLWGLTVGQWAGRFEKDFIVRPCRDIFIREKGRHEAVFFLQKPEAGNDNKPKGV